MFQDQKSDNIILPTFDNAVVIQRAKEMPGDW